MLFLVDFLFFFVSDLIDEYDEGFDEDEKDDKKRLECSFDTLSIYLVSFWSVNVSRANAKMTRVSHLTFFY